ncbi:hypothetical protein RUND412_002241 [Rhizina undulata]
MNPLAPVFEFRFPGPGTAVKKSLNRVEKSLMTVLRESLVVENETDVESEDQSEEHEHEHIEEQPAADPDIEETKPGPLKTPESGSKRKRRKNRKSAEFKKHGRTTSGQNNGAGTADLSSVPGSPLGRFNGHRPGSIDEYVQQGVFHQPNGVAIDQFEGVSGTVFFRSSNSISGANGISSPPQNNGNANGSGQPNVGFAQGTHSRIHYNFSPPIYGARQERGFDQMFHFHANSGGHPTGNGFGTGFGSEFEYVMHQHGAFAGQEYGAYPGPGGAFEGQFNPAFFQHGNSVGHGYGNIPAGAFDNINGFGQMQYYFNPEFQQGQPSVPEPEQKKMAKAESYADKMERWLYFGDDEFVPAGLKI